MISCRISDMVQKTAQAFILFVEHYKLEIDTNASKRETTGQEYVVSNFRPGISRMHVPAKYSEGAWHLQPHNRLSNILYVGFARLYKYLSPYMPRENYSGPEKYGTSNRVVFGKSFLRNPISHSLTLGASSAFPPYSSEGKCGCPTPQKWWFPAAFITWIIMMPLPSWRWKSGPLWSFLPY